MRRIIKNDKLTIDLAHYIFKCNQDGRLISFFSPDTYQELNELIADGAIIYSLYDDNSLIATLIADIVLDNKTIEVTGPYGNVNDCLELINILKNDYSSYHISLFISDTNELLKYYNAVSKSYSMEIKCSNKSYDNVYSLSDSDSLELHDSLFKNSYMNSESLRESNDTILIYKELDFVRGYIAFDKTSGYLDFLGVDSNYRNKGVATNLINACLSMMNGSMLRLTVDEKNEEAVKLYKKLGFRITTTMTLVII